VMESVFESFGLSFVISNPREQDNPIVYASENFYKTTGYSPKEVINRNCRFLQGKDTSRQSVCEIRDAIREERATSTCLLNYRKNGTPFWNAFHLEPVKDVHGMTEFYIGVQVDVTEMFKSALGEAAVSECSKDVCSKAQQLANEVKKYADKLHENARVSVAVADSIPSPLLSGLSTINHAFCLTDPSIPGNPMVYCSPGFLRMTRYSSSELIGKPCSMLQGELTDQKEVEKIRAAIHHEPPRPVSACLANYRKDGEVFMNSVHIAPVNCSSGKVKYFCGVQSEVPMNVDEGCKTSNPLVLLKQKGVIGAVRVAARGLADSGLVRKPDHQVPCNSVLNPDKLTEK